MAYPEISTVHVDITRTSLVDGISPATWKPVEDITDLAVRSSFFFLLLFPPKIALQSFQSRASVKKTGPGTVYHNVNVYLVDNNWEATDWYICVLSCNILLLLEYDIESSVL